jgi:excisionase family DNA binding protein
MSEPLLLSPTAASERLGVGRSAIYQLVRAGRLRAVRPLALAGELRFRDADLVRFVTDLEAVDPATMPASVADETPARARLATAPRRRRTPRTAA